MDVFISYSRSDLAFVRKLAEAVAREGYSVWWDADLPPHRAYGDVITEEIGGAAAAIVVWSRTAAASEWVRAEADVARNQKKLIQTSIDGSMPPMPFNQIQFASIEDWDGEADHPGWRKVKASLSILCGKGDAPAPAPPSRAVPAPPPPAAPPRPDSQKSGRGQMLVIGALVLLLLAGAVTIGLLWNRPERVREVVRVESAPAPRADAPAERPRREPLSPQPRPAAEPASEAAEPADRFPRAAVINDPDGFTNVRDTPSVNGAIVGRINEGERFSTRIQQRPWWRVRMPNGAEGWVHRSRIRLVD